MRQRAEIRELEAVGHRFGVRPRARMQLSKAADLPPALASAAWRSHSVASALKEFVAGLLLFDVGRGAYCGAQAGNKSSSPASNRNFINDLIRAKFRVPKRALFDDDYFVLDRSYHFLMVKLG